MRGKARDAENEACSDQQETGKAGCAAGSPALGNRIPARGQGEPVSLKVVEAAPGTSKLGFWQEQMQD